MKKYITNHHRKIQTKITLKYHLHLSDWFYQKDRRNILNVEKRKPSYSVGENVNWYSHCRKQYNFPPKLKIKLFYDPEIPLLCMYLKEMKPRSSFFFFFFVFYRATPMAYGDSQARDPIEAVAAGQCQSHRNARSEPSLQPTPQLTGNARSLTH